MSQTVGDGRTSYHQYQLLKPAADPIPADAVYIDGAPYIPVASVEGLKFKVSDGNEDLLEWTDLPLNSVGEIEIPGQVNRVRNSRRKRFLTLFAIHDGGKHLPMEIEYSLVDYNGITTETVPKVQ